MVFKKWELFQGGERDCVCICVQFLRKCPRLGLALFSLFTHFYLHGRNTLFTHGCEREVDRYAKYDKNILVHCAKLVNSTM